MTESGAEPLAETSPPDISGPQPDPVIGAGKKEKKKKREKDKGLGTSRGVETMFRMAYRSHLTLSQMADNKANIMISINGIMISVVIASISPKIDANPWLLVPTGVLLVGCAISLVYAVLAARPRVTQQELTLADVERNNANILFFGNFVGLSEPDFVTGLTTLMQDTERLYVNMMRDIYGLGRVLQRKYTLLRTSYTTFMVALVVSVLLFVGVFMGVVNPDDVTLVP